MALQQQYQPDQGQPSYPYADHPPPGTSLEIAPGVRWLSMPMGGSLNHINLYLLEDAAGWYVVDTGLANEQVRVLWQQLFAGDMGGKPVLGVICTHMHPDHTGQAAMITEQFQCPLLMTQLEFLHMRMMQAGGGGPGHFLNWQGRQHFQRAGMDMGFFDQIQAMWEARKAELERDPEQGRNAGMLGIQFPGSYQRLLDGQVLSIGGREWQVVTGAGHSPEHACLYNRQLGILLSGDQILPVITSNVSVQPVEPEANPLQAWLDSHLKLLRLPADTLVLPAHNLPFYGIRERLRHLIWHHEDRMLIIEEQCASTPRSAAEMLPALFRRELEPMQRMMALGEAIAHINLLLHRFRLRRDLGADGVYRYSAIDPELARRLNPKEHADAGDTPMFI